jgi:surfeit locus 1 family protein
MPLIGTPVDGNMRIDQAARRRFRPRLGYAVLTALGVAVFVSLGFWQLDRADQRRAIQRDYAARQSDAPIEVGAAPMDGQGLRYYNASASGAYDGDHQILLANRVHDGVLGYEVLTPLRIVGSDMRVLVNRGWVPHDYQAASTPQPPVPEGEVRITGRLVVPSPNRFAMGEPGGASFARDAVWQTLDLGALQGAAPFPVQPFVLQLAPDQSGGFVRNWPAPEVHPERNTGYAIQWFTFALIALAIFLARSFRPTDADK